MELETVDSSWTDDIVHLIRADSLFWERMTNSKFQI